MPEPIHYKIIPTEQRPTQTKINGMYDGLMETLEAGATIEASLTESQRAFIRTKWKKNYPMVTLHIIKTGPDTFVLWRDDGQSQGQ